MKFVLISGIVLDAGCLLWLLIAAVREPRKIAGRFKLLLPVPLCCLVAAILGYEVFRRSDPGPLAFLLLLWLIYCGAVTLITAQRYRIVQNVALEQKHIERHYAQEEEYYDQLLEKQEQTRALWHDIEKYLRAADVELAESNAYTEARRLFSEATGIADVGNRVLNVILNEYKAKAEAEGAKLLLRISVPQTLSVSVADLYILIGNTLDNAIASVKTLPLESRTIEVSVRLAHEVLYYRTINPVGTGTSRSGHGYGLKNVRACVKKYNGAASVSIENGFFIFSAHLNSVS